TRSMTGVPLCVFVQHRQLDEFGRQAATLHYPSSRRRLWVRCQPYSAPLNREACNRMSVRAFAREMRALLLCLAFAVATFAARAAEIVGKLVNVHDGDTLTILVDRT